MKPQRVAVVGATGAVGQEFLAVLAARRLPLAELRLLASPRSAGRELPFAGAQLPVQALGPSSFAGIDVALFSAGAAVSRQFAPHAVAAGAVVVDNSSAFRLDPAVPLVVPEVNASALAGHRGIVANPNCSTILLALALWPLHRAAGLRAVVVSTYQAASGAGQQAMLELRQGLAAMLAGEAPPAPRALPQPLAGNVFPQVDVFQPDGYTREEDKLLHELRKILDLPALAVDATCVRVPVERCHSEAVAAGFERPLTVAAARELLASAPGVELVDDPSALRYPMPLAMAGRDPVAVGRLRLGRVFSPGLTFWLAGDQLRKGAALNAVQIAELLAQRRGAC
ncbi:MAG: aspartate-semialdehyde dehydrogenase [Planctomycetes bacterium]|nr:aspartate-semialdehyde dehydrogenase [Planctomycetota bacterium]